MSMWTETGRRVGSKRWALVCGLIALIVAGCDGRSDKSTGSTDVATTGDDVEADVTREQREAYGLVLPPAVDRVERTDTMVEVETSLSIDQLSSYYGRKLKNYELFRLGDGTLEVIGLRSFMPAIRAHQVGPLTTVTYVPSREPPEPTSVPDAGVGEAAESAPADQQRPTESRILLGPGAGNEATSGLDREPGTAVEVRTESGELLAPGAKWGEPYTPPPGSPLHQPRFESNFGLPFGEWHMD
jgi:hypothetical protein